MKYICFNHYKKQSIQGPNINIHYSEPCELIGESIIYNNTQVCYVNSLQGHKHFARNDDGQGLLRGKLTYAIAYSNRSIKHSDGHYARFSESEIELFRLEYMRFLKQDDPILFNKLFFTAEISELQEIADRLHIKI